MQNLNEPTDAQIEAEIDAAFAEVARHPTERPTPWDELSDEQIAEYLNDDRR